MPDAEPPEPQNPIVALAAKIRARRALGAAIDAATVPAQGAAGGQPADDAEARFAALADVLAAGAKRLATILGRNGVTFVRLEKPLRLRLRFRDKRVTLDLDRERQLVVIGGAGLDGEYQFDTAAAVPALICVSRLSTESGYGEHLTGSSLLRELAAEAELPPPHLEGPGPLQF